MTLEPNPNIPSPKFPKIFDEKLRISNPTAGILRLPDYPISAIVLKFAIINIDRAMGCMDSFIAISKCNSFDYTIISLQPDHAFGGKGLSAPQIRGWPQNCLTSPRTDNGEIGHPDERTNLHIPSVARNVGWD